MKLSIAIPVYNEEHRLPAKLEPYLRWLDENAVDYEIVLVDDGSTDGTLRYLKNLSFKNKRVRFIHSPRNRGRGFGMKTGVLSATGDYILETDADLPVSPDHIITFLKFLEENPEYDYAIGSRGHPQSTFLLKQPAIRVFAGNVFHGIFSFLFGGNYKDVMCGFKMFRRDAAHEIFKYVYDERYLAAAEVVFAGSKFGFALKELPVVWEDDRRSKVGVLKDTLRTIFGLGGMMLRNLGGKYERIEPKV